ncbi:MAG: hypothetical protein M1813_000649 [Trichoglossum hirsutum]|nr:MAG: hypothetical protein M1813_000649 [Trichoglossum hirsutum]
MATKTTIALRSLLRSLKAGRICKLEDLSALEILITPCRPADPQTRKDIPIPAECEDLQRRMNEIVDLLGRAKAKGLKHPNMKRTPQDLAAGSSIEALTMYCGLNYEMDYTCNGNKLMLFVSKRIYVMPDLETPYGEAMEFTLGQARISIVYLSLPRDEADCAVYARELFCLLAMATKSCRVRAEDQSHTVSALAGTERL